MEKKEPPKEKLTPFSRISEFFSLQKSEVSLQHYVEDSESRWQIPQGTQMKTKLCGSCSTYNEAESNYCSSCGSLISDWGTVDMTPSGA